MQVKKYATSTVSSLVCMAFMANAGATFEGARMADGANVGIFGQAALWAVCGIASMVFAGWKLPKAGTVQTSTFDNDMDSVRQLAESCGGGQGVQDALEVIQKAALRKQMPPTIANPEKVKADA